MYAKMVYSITDRKGGCYATQLTRSHGVGPCVLVFTTIPLKSLTGTGISKPIVGAMRHVLYLSVFT